MLRWNRLYPALCAASSLGIASCGGDKATAPQTGPSPPQPKPVASVQVTPSTHTLAALGATQQFQAVAKAADGTTVSGKTFTWASSETNVATIDASSGIATAVTNGSTSITATTDGVPGTASLTVAQTSNALMMRTQPTGAAAGQPFTTQPVVEVHDANGNVAENDNSTVVTAATASGGGTLLGTTTATALAGVVTFADLAIGGTVGDRTLTFTAQGLMAVTSGSFALAPGPAAQMALGAGNNQTALAATAVTFSVKVIDAFDNGVPNVDVGWNVTSGSGTLAQATTTTGASGVASNSYSLGRFAAVETVEASITGLTGSPISFSATATPNGTISGTITLSNAFLAPPQATKVAVTSARLVPPSRYKRSPIQNRAAPVQLRTAAPSGPEYVPDELIVTFRSGPLSAPLVGAAAMAAPATAQAVASSIRAALSPHVQPGRLAVAGVSPAILAARVKVANPSELDAVAAELRANPSVSVVERNAIVRLERRAGSVSLATMTTPNDPFYPWQAWHYAMIDLPEAWSVATGNASILVAVVDDGIRFDHPGIAANLTADGYDFVSEAFSIAICGGGSISNSGDGGGYDADPTNPSDVIIDPILDCISGVRTSGNHGLHVAGTVGAVGNDASGGTGVNWNVRVRPIRVLGLAGGTSYDIAQGILYAAGLPADDGAGTGGTVQPLSTAAIINLSLKASTTTDLQNAVISASNAGVLIVAAAGNDGTSVPNYPAAYPQTLSVSAVGPDRLLASYSSFGSTVDIAAPGGDLVDGGGTFGVWSTAWNYVTDVAIFDGTVWNGTSMAAPHVSGVAALLLAQNPTLTAADLKARLINYAVDVGAAGPDDLYGYGIVNARNSLTQSFAPTQQLFARLIDANSGVLVQTVAAQPDGSYAFTELADTDYFVYAGQDADGDLQIGIPGRRWGAFGGSATPTPVTVNGAGTYPATFSTGLPIEVEPNDAFAQADVLSIGGYLLGTISDPAADADAMLVQIPADGQYTFETSAVDGACGFALEEDTILRLYNSSGTEIAVNDDIDFAGAIFCSRISMMLSAGTHYVGVTGYFGGRYAVAVREGI